MKANKVYSHAQELARCQEFLRDFEDYDRAQAHPVHLRRKYLIQMQSIADGKADAIEIALEDAQKFFRKQEEFRIIQGIRTNSKRYASIFESLVVKLMPHPTTGLPIQAQISLREQRIDNIQVFRSLGLSSNQKLPKRLLLDADVRIVFGDSPKKTISSISNLSSDMIGSLVHIRAIVTKTTQVKPEIVVAVYACTVCGCENYQVVSDPAYSQLTVCQSERCKKDKYSGQLIFLPSHSVFRPCQTVYIQELTEQLQDGAIPRTIAIEAKGSLSNCVSPGDQILIDGILLPRRKTNYKAQRSLTFETYIEATRIRRQKKKYNELELNIEQLTSIQLLRQSVSEDALFRILADSIAPEIFGMHNVKKALLLMMAQGVTITTEDFVMIRGEINVALIGDPGIAKSQLLKRVSRLAQRGIYVTGRGSTSVGLTAAVVSGEDNELSLEAGALVLADMGICCIDEFDKMNENDRTAIHEVMEQQTVSIAKAGIATSLNARTGILAAANPLMGRYDPRKTPLENVNLPSALLSRFDLVFILQDHYSEDSDRELSSHILRVHKDSQGPVNNAVGINLLRSYLAQARTFKPTVGAQLHSSMIARYIQKRKQQLEATKVGSSYITMRSLLALIRLSQARAKLRFSNQVSQQDVNDCLEIIESSQQGIELIEQQSKVRVDNVSRVFEIIRDLCRYSRGMRISVEEAEKRVEARGFSKKQLSVVVEHYSMLNVLMVQANSIVLIEQ